MRRLLTLLIAAGFLAGLWVVLRELLAGTEGGSLERDEGGGPTTSQPSPAPAPSSVPSERTGAAPGERGNGAREVSKAELYRQAQRLDVQGRSKMSKKELAKAVAEARKRTG